jgi:hypothetical protein
MRVRHLFYLCMALCAFCACTTGPSTEEGNPQIVAVIVDGDNRPVAGALVVAYLMPTNNNLNVQPETARSATTTRTGPDGSCLFEGLDPGRYSVVASDNAGIRSAMRSDIIITVMVPDAPEFSDTLVLAATGGIRGTVTRNGVQGLVSNQILKDAFIQVRLGEIYGVYTTIEDGAYSFGNLPAGVYSLYFYATDGFLCTKRDSITVVAGDTTVENTVILTPWPRLVPPIELRAGYDTSAGIVTLRWQRVQYDSLRWYEVERIDLAGPRDTVCISIDTLYHDTVKGIPAGTVLDYVVRSVDKAFNRSANAGPVEITVAR